MTSIITAFNTHKESIKYGAQIFQCAAGGVALYHLVRGRIYSREEDTAVETPGRLTYTAAQIGFICTAATTPWGVKCLSTIVQKVFTAAQIKQRFGPNTIFEPNWKHLRHVVSLLGSALAIPAALRCFVSEVPKQWLHHGIQWTAFASLITSRLFLHIGSQVVQLVLLKMKSFN